ncbi:MAG TPA: CHAP domain-containing protein, partial [Rhizomicrobium sp.]|nr:CHAP domain-containing protein [Rhizomicrobium sp.]
MTFGSLIRLASVAAICAALGGCGSIAGTNLSTAGLAYSHGTNVPATPVDDPTLFPDDDSDNAPATVDGTRLQCVPYARQHSGVNLHGDAYTWWDKAAGLYARTNSPLLGSVLVLNGYARRRAHVAVVSRIVSPREIRIDHANWLDDGAIYVNDPVVDVSENNDWTMVKVWNIRTGSWGTRTY